MTTEPPKDDDEFDDSEDDDEIADFDEDDPRAVARRNRNRDTSKLPPDLKALVEEIGTADLAHYLLPTIPRYRFDRFEVLDFMVGGMGLVLQAHDPKLDRQVAIKLWMHEGPKAETSLLAEARALAKLSHPNIVTIHDTGTWEGRVYFVMEWVDGVDGSEWMRTRRPWQEIRDVFVQAGRGLAAAHDAGILHRDFKPSNMLVGFDGRVRVSDFGIAEFLGDKPDDPVGALAGTLEYMAPERLVGARCDQRSDVFSFCVSMWQVLYGTRPFHGSTRAVLVEEIYDGGIHGDVDVSDRPEWLWRTIVCGLLFKPSERCPNMQVLLWALENEKAPEPDDGEEEEEEDGDDGDGDGDDGEIAPDGDGSPPLLHGPALLRDQGEAIDLAGGQDQDGAAVPQNAGSSVPPLAYGSGQPQVARWMFAAFGGGLALGLVGVLTFIGGSWWATRVLEHGHREPTDAEETRKTVVVDDVPITPEQVIEHIEAGTYDEAIEAEWKTEEQRRASLEVPTYHDNQRISEAFLQQYGLLKERDQEAAKSAFSGAAAWSSAARTNLNRYDQSDLADVVEGLDELEERIEAAREELKELIGD